MEGQPRPLSNESIPRSAETVLSVRAIVEKELRMLLRMQAQLQAAERKHRAQSAPKGGGKPEQQKRGWAEPLQESVRAQIEEIMESETLTDEDWTLNHPVVATLLRDIVERGKVGKIEIPADKREMVADFCKRKSEDPDAMLRSMGLLWASRMLGMSKKPTGAELDPDTMRFLAGLRYETGETNGGAHMETEGRAQRGPKQIAARLQSRTAAIRESAMGEFDTSLERWILRPPTQEDARKEHFGDVELVIDAAEVAMDKVSALTAEKKNNLSCRMQTARASIASKRTGEARIRRT